MKNRCLSHFVAVALLATTAVSSATFYEDWLQENFAPGVLGNPGLEATVWGPKADPDEDDVPNVIEYACVSDPNSPNTSSIPDGFSVELRNVGPQQFLFVIYKRPRYAPSLDVIVESSSDSANWQDALVADLQHESTADLNYRTQLVTLRTVSPFLTDHRRFYRVSVTLKDHDLDGDKLPDDWEQIIADANLLDGINGPGDVLPGDDFDGDGVSNEDEYLNGTDPTDPDDVRVQAPPRNPSLGMDDDDNPSGSVLLHSGELWLQRTDMRIRARSLGFRFIRHYRSRCEQEGPLGHCWDANVFRRIEETVNGDVICFPGNGRHDQYPFLGANIYASPVGFYTRLRKVPSGWELRDRYGTIDRYDQLGRLVQVETRTDDIQQYVYTGPLLTSVIDEFGRVVTFAYNVSDQLETITDFTGRVVRYDYDAEDNLVAVTSPTVTGTPDGNDFPTGKTERYDYDIGNTDIRLAHNLLEIVAPNEVDDGTLTPCMINIYGTAGSNYDRLLTHVYGGTNATGRVAGGTLTYTYNFGPGGGPAGSVRRTRVEDRRGLFADYFHDATGHCLRYIEDPNGATPYVTTREYNFHGECTRRILPETNEKRFTYDDANIDAFHQGNLLSEIRLPDAARGGTQTQITTTYVYDPIYNRRVVEIAPRGTDASYVPQTGGVQSAARYTTRWIYDYMEGAAPPAEAVDWNITVPPPLLNLGDVNQDGRTDMVLGSMVRCDYPTVQLFLAPNQSASEGDPNQERVVLRRYNDFGQLTEHEDQRGNIDTYDYYAENDPDGDGQDIVGGKDPVTGGYLRLFTEDAIIGPNRLDPPPAQQLTRESFRDRRGNEIRFDDARGKEHIRIYNELDQVIIIEAPKVDANQPDGYEERFHYDANDNVVRVETENEKTDPNTHESVVVGSHPLFTDVHQYDILDNVIEETKDAKRDPAIPASAEPETLVTRFHYDANDNPVRTESPRSTSGADPNNATTTTYDERDLVFQLTRGAGSPGASTTTYTYDLNGNQTDWTDAEDNDGVAGPEIGIDTYDGFDRVVSTTDRDGNVATYTYDPGDRLTERERQGPIDGSGGPNEKLDLLRLLWDEAGRRAQADEELFLPVGASPTRTITLVDGPLTGGDGFVSTRFEYDGLHRQTFKVEDDGAIYVHRYDSADRLVSTTSPLQDPGGTFQETRLEYDGNDNVVRRVETHVSPLGAQAPQALEFHSVFDAIDRVTRETDTRGFTTYTEYDSRDNIVATYDARGASTPDPLGLYAFGNINDRGNATRFNYDGINRLWTRERELRVGGDGSNPLDTSNPAIPTGIIEIGSEYDANSNVVRRVDGNGNTTTYTYDSIDRITLRTHPDGGTRSWTYDRDHHPINCTDENGSTFIGTFDSLDRIRQIDATPVATLIPSTILPMLVGTTQQSFEYDGLSRMTNCTDNNDPGDATDDWQVTSIYDSLSRLVEENQNGFATSSDYDSDDRSQCVYPSGLGVAYQYDAQDQLIGVTTPRMQCDTALLGTRRDYIARACFFFNPGPQLVLDTQQQLDANLLVFQSDVLAPGSAAPAGQIGAQLIQRNRKNNIDVQQLGYAFDMFNQMTLNYNLGRSSIEQTSVYDRLQDINGIIAQTFRESAYGPVQEILEVSDGLVAIQSNTFSSMYERTNAPFDYNAGQTSGTGLRTEDAQHVIQFDAFNRVRVIRDATTPAVVIAEYDYDSNPCVTGGRRVEKEVQNSGALDGTTRFYYDGIHCVEETDVPLLPMPELLERQNFYGGCGPYDILATDVDLNADGNPDELFFYVKDARNAVTQLVGTNGNPVEFYACELYAEPQIYLPSFAGINQLPFSQAGNPYLCSPGRRWEPETGLYYCDADCRYFDPFANEYLSRDICGAWCQPINLGNGQAVRGNDALANSKSSNPRDTFTPDVYILKKNEGRRHTPFSNSYRPQFYFRTTDVTGSVKLTEGTEMVMPGDNIAPSGFSLLAENATSGGATSSHDPLYVNVPSRLVLPQGGLRVGSESVINDRDTGRSKGFGFVELSNSEKKPADIGQVIVLVSDGQPSGGSSSSSSNNDIYWHDPNWRNRVYLPPSWSQPSFGGGVAPSLPVPSLPATDPYVYGRVFESTPAESLRPISYGIANSMPLLIVK